MICPVCGIQLRVLDGRMAAASVGLFILIMIGAGLVVAMGRSFLNDSPIFFVFYIVCMVGYFMSEKYRARLLQLQVLEAGVKPGFPLVTLAEDLKAAREAAEEDTVVLEEAPDTGPAWICPKCQAENPGNFDECWKCQTWRTDRPTSVDSATKTHGSGSDVSR